MPIARAVAREMHAFSAQRETAGGCAERYVTTCKRVRTGASTRGHLPAAVEATTEWRMSARELQDPQGGKAIAAGLRTFRSEEGKSAAALAVASEQISAERSVERPRHDGTSVPAQLPMALPSGSIPAGATAISVRRRRSDRRPCRWVAQRAMPRRWP